MPLLTKPKLLEIIRQVPIPQAQAMLEVTQDAVDLLNKLLDRVLDKLFPLDSSAVEYQVRQRISNLATLQGSVFDELKQRIERDVQDQRPMVPSGIPHSSIKTAIRENAGNVSVPQDTLNFVDYILHLMLFDLLMHVFNDLPAHILQGITKFEAKYILQFLYQTDLGKNYPLHKPPTGPLEKGGKGKSPSKKRRSSARKKKCSSREVSVRGFVRDGKRIKSYCRKKSTKK